MYINQFSLNIPEGKENADGYVSLHNGQCYKIRMRNDRSVECDAIVKVDGQNVGTWRINPRSAIEIDRPADKARLFTFYILGTVESEAAMLDLVHKDELGLISVEFKPAKKIEPTVTFRHDCNITQNSSAKSFGVSFGEPAKRSGISAGGTGLSGTSSQKFGIAKPIEYDEANVFTINLRLIALEELPLIEPLSPRSTPVPPPVCC
jgi:hypothetical protein